MTFVTCKIFQINDFEKCALIVYFINSYFILFYLVLSVALQLNWIWLRTSDTFIIINADVQNNGRNGSNFVIQPNCWVMEIVEIVRRSTKCGVFETQVANLLSWIVSNETLTEMWHLNLIELHYCDYRGLNSLIFIHIQTSITDSNGFMSKQFKCKYLFNWYALSCANQNELSIIKSSNQ